MVQAFLSTDVCCRVSDKVSPIQKHLFIVFFKIKLLFFFCLDLVGFLPKAAAFHPILQYLLAMALTYFKRAGLPTSEYTPLNLFAAL